VQRPIPIWFGGRAKPALRRAALLGDGFIPPSPAPPRPLQSEWVETLAWMRRERAQAGVEAPLGLEPRIQVEPGDDPEAWKRAAAEWAELGATHISVKTTGIGLDSPAEHLEKLGAVRAALDGAVEIG
jgi:alkanesulfonate monooxygenase SsuD/methylene tetrahydromethanopterin reductase-like flavin-dependent oxidoreductase (luciferase family)